MITDAMQTYKRYPTLDMVKTATGVDLDELEKMLAEMDTLLSDAYVVVAEKFKIADAAFIKLDDTMPGCPDDQPGFMELTEKEADAEYEKAEKVNTHHCDVEKVVIKLEAMKKALGEVTS